MPTSRHTLAFAMLWLPALPEAASDPAPQNTPSAGQRTVAVEELAAETPPVQTAKETTSTQTSNEPTVKAVASGFGLEVGTGMHGGLSFIEGGVLFPRFVPHLTGSLKLTAMSAVNWVTFSNLDTGQTVSLHPVIVGGVLSVGGSSDVMHDVVRVYGGADLLLGTTLTPYDSFFYDRENLIGPNLSYGIFGHFGFELLTSEHWATFVEAGGGFRSLKVETENPYAVAAAWLGSGATLKLGTRFYF
ncbi:MAG: hypothetical protein ABIJ09_13265 [Pseudomonadota bacterium]